MGKQVHIKELSLESSNEIKSQCGEFEIALIMKKNGDIDIYKCCNGKDITPDDPTPPSVIGPSNHRVSQITTIASPGCMIINGVRYCW